MLLPSALTWQRTSSRLLRPMRTGKWLLEAVRAQDIKPVAVKSIEQQALQALHRTRSGWMSTRTRRINTLRGFCREFGLVVPEGAATGLAQIAALTYLRRFSCFAGGVHMRGVRPHSRPVQDKHSEYVSPFLLR